MSSYDVAELVWAGTAALPPTCKFSYLHNTYTQHIHTTHVVARRVSHTHNIYIHTHTHTPA